MVPAQITTNVIEPGVQVSVLVAFPDGTCWTGILHNTSRGTGDA